LYGRADVVGGGSDLDCLKDRGNTRHLLKKPLVCHKPQTLNPKPQNPPLYTLNPKT